MFASQISEIDMQLLVARKHSPCAVHMQARCQLRLAATCPGLVTAPCSWKDSLWRGVLLLQLRFYGVADIARSALAATLRAACLPRPVRGHYAAGPSVCPAITVTGNGRKLKAKMTAQSETATSPPPGPQLLGPQLRLARPPTARARAAHPLAPTASAAARLQLRLVRQLARRCTWPPAYRDGARGLPPARRRSQPPAARRNPSAARSEFAKKERGGKCDANRERDGGDEMSV